MRIILDLNPANGTVAQWTVTIDDNDNDNDSSEPSTGRLSRTQMKHLAGELDELLRVGGPDWTNETIHVARRVGEAHMASYTIRRPVERNAVGIEF